MQPQTAILVPLWWTKYMSDTVEVTSVSRGADAIPCTTRMTARETKDCFMSTKNLLAHLSIHTLVKNPHTFVARRMTVEMMKKGRLPQMFAPAAVKNVVKPIQKARKPMIRLETISMLTLYFMAMSGSAGVTMGPRLAETQLVETMECLRCLRCCYTGTESEQNHDAFLPFR